LSGALLDKSTRGVGHLGHRAENFRRKNKGQFGSVSVWRFLSWTGRFDLTEWHAAYLAPGQDRV